MRIAILGAAFGVALAAAVAADKAEAKTYFSFDLYGPGYGFSYGPSYYHGPGYYYGPGYYHAPGYYPYYEPYYSAPRHYYRAHRYRRGGCGYWRRQCTRNWGYRNADYYGCLRYHGC